MPAKNRLVAVLCCLVAVLLVSACAQNEDIQTNHLDVGFTGTVVQVMNLYFKIYFPKAINVAKELRSKGGKERLIYTTHPWLVSFYLDCPAHIWAGLYCPNATEIAAFSEAIKQGDITWHAFPFNAEPEIMDDSLFENGLMLAKELSQQFGLPQVRTMSQRDVPGMTRGAVPLLAKHGIQAVTVGVNGASAPPSVPKIFKWQDKASQTEVIGMWNPGGYGTFDAAGNVMDHIVSIPSYPEAIAFFFRSDNAGPPDAKEVTNTFATLQSLFPNANIVASKFDDFVDGVVKSKVALPLYTAEIGDTWLYGCSSDPLKLAQFRAMSRLRKECLQNSKCNPNDKNFKDFNRFLLKLGEHTWGTDVKIHLHDFKNWSNAQFTAAKTQSNYVNLVGSWIEQRSFVDMALAALGPNELALAIHEELKELVPSIPSTHDFVPADPAKRYTSGNLIVGFDTETGAINYLYDTRKKQNYASASNTLGQILYQTYDADDYAKFLANYMYCNISNECRWGGLDFGKPNVTLGNPVHATYTPKLKALYQKSNAGKDVFLAELTMDESAHQLAGAPERCFVEYAIHTNVHTSEMHIRVMCFNKTPTRLPESLSVTFNPLVNNPQNWFMDKLGSLVSPMDVLRNGSQHQHGIQTGLHYIVAGDTQLSIHSLDAGVVMPGAPTPFPTPLQQQPDMSLGFHFNLVNNIWGTNYIMWYPFNEQDENIAYRFKVVIA